MKSRLSLVERYTVLSLGLIIGSLALLGMVYMAVADSITERLAGERLNAQLAATANRVSAFVENHIYQLQTLSNHPAIPLYLTYNDGVPAGVEELVRVEADSPDLYGILFFDSDDRLVEVIAGQAASGAPYWSATGWSIATLPRTRLGNTEIIGPSLPGQGKAGWVLIRHAVRQVSGKGMGGFVALHVRLASLTELIRTENLTGVIRPFLRTPDGVLLAPTGIPLIDEPPGIIAGPELFPGWRIDYLVTAEDILRPLRDAQMGLWGLALFMGAGIMLLFWALARSLRRRVDRLVAGADALASGDLHFRLRVPVDRKDEIDVVAHAFNAMADRLRDMIQRTLQVEKMAVLGEFATGVAHEVRNPLATIKLNVQALGRRESDAKRRAVLEDVEGEIDRLTRVVGDLLDYGRPSPGEPQRFEVRDAFAVAVKLVARQAETQAINLTINVDAPQYLYANRDQVIQCLMNVLLNAIDACESGGAVQMRASLDGGHVCLEIADNGCGMTEDVRQRVTEPFYTNRLNGTGLGLSITRQLVLLNNGEMRIDSTPGQGTTIALILPVADG